MLRQWLLFLPPTPLQQMLPITPYVESACRNHGLPTHYLVLQGALDFLNLELRGCFTERNY